MKIYFAGSIRGGRDDAIIYRQIVDHLIGIGHSVLSEHIADQGLTGAGNAKPAEAIYRQDTDWIREADLVVAEVTQPSLGVGYELGLAESISVPVVCLWRKSEDRKLSAMVSGNDYVTVIEYVDADELMQKLSEITDKNV